MTKMISKQQLGVMGAFLRRHIVGICIIFVCLLFVIEILCIGNIVYAAKWVQCGRQPVVERVYTPDLGIESEPADVTITTHPGFFDSKTPLILYAFETPKLYCSLDDAKNAYHKTVPDPRNVTIR